MHMKNSRRARFALDAVIPPAQLARAQVPGAHRAHWKGVAEQMSVREAIACLLERQPKQQPIEVLELLDNRKAQQVNRINAAYAVLAAALLAPEPADG
jgi:hypothetical protein